jgi:protein involved in polysaccharide export with SLBB domain
LIRQAELHSRVFGMSFQHRIVVAFLVMCAGVVSNARAQAVASARAETVLIGQARAVGDAVLHPGDHLRITVLSDDKDLTGEFEVAPDGTLKHPLYNKVHVAGLPVATLKDQIVSFLRKFQKEPQVEVEPLFEVTINGEVNKPGVFFLAPETTVQRAVESASEGTTNRANRNAVSLLRDGRKLPVRLAEDSRGENVQTIQSGDHISVGAQRSVMANITPFVGVGVSLISLAVLIISHR